MYIIEKKYFPGKEMQKGESEDRKKKGRKE